MTGLNHLESCVRRASEVRLKREEYNEQYPFHCRFCEGWGGTVPVNDPSLAEVDFDVEVGEFPEVLHCPRCVGSSRCPRCGSDMDHESSEPCDFCGFAGGVTEGKPYPHACFCGTLEDELFGGSNT